MSHAPRHLILRTGWLFGPYGRNYVTDLVAWRETEPVVFGFEDHRSQPTYQLDFVDAALELVRRGATGLWHVAPPGEANQCDVARETYRLLGADAIEVKPVRRGLSSFGAPRPKYSVLATAKLGGLGIPMRPWREGLRAFLSSLPRA
jgi:dTDP-4-dehydrorhamnose reductase